MRKALDLCSSSSMRSDAENVELVHVQQNCSWSGYLISAPQHPHGRSTAFQLALHETLLWAQGNLRAVADGKDYYKEDKGCPNLPRSALLRGTPVHVTRSTLTTSVHNHTMDVGVHGAVALTRRYAYDGVPITELAHAACLSCTNFSR